jgi:hypothetical protein
MPATPGSKGRVKVLEEVKLPPTANQYELCLQWCRYVYDDGVVEDGYRFVWRRPDGTIQGARGQARIPSLSMVNHLVSMANDAGWGANVGNPG